MDKVFRVITSERYYIKAFHLTQVYTHFDILIMLQLEPNGVEMDVA